MYLAYLGANILIYLAQKAEIALLLVKKVIILVKYADFLDVLSKESTAMLFACTDINDYTINLEPCKLSLYEDIYDLSLVELETLKTFIKTNPTNGLFNLPNLLYELSFFFSGRVTETFVYVWITAV